MAKLNDKLKQLPLKPGVYLFKDSSGEVIYVGKAKNLKNRVKSYFVKGQGRVPRTEIMIQKIADLDWIIVSSEVESLILENNLIKQYHPPFNVSLRDDKDYQFIKIDYATEIPQIYSTRRVDRDAKNGKAKYFGPYTSGLAVRSTLKLIDRVFHLCRNKKIGKKPCFNYLLKRCPGVCIGEISPSEYKKTLHEIEHFFKHEQTAILKELKIQMKQAARNRQFEKAALARDKIRGLVATWEKQKIASSRRENQDYLGLYVTPREAVINLFVVRLGKLIRQEHFNMKHEQNSAAEILEKFLMQYYPESSDLPKEIFMEEKLPDLETIEAALSKLKGQRVYLMQPTRGKKLGLNKLAAENAKAFYERELASFEKQEAEAELLLSELQKLLGLPAVPARIEAFDISNIQGRNPVGSMIVFSGAKLDKSQYRKFKINVKDTPDDFAMMREMLERRFNRRRMDEGQWPKPDLVIIDGGKGQLNVALHEIPYSKFHIPIIGLAKRLEEIFVPGKKQSIRLPENSPVLFLLQRIRDEAHRFAITFYRGRHGKQMVKSKLDEIPGVGPVTKKILITKFGTVSAIRNTPLEALAREIGTAKAKIIKERL